MQNLSNQNRLILVRALLSYDFEPFSITVCALRLHISSQSVCLVWRGPKQEGMDVEDKYGEYAFL